jgi:carbon storage regulator
MLVRSRKPGETLVIGGVVRVRVLEVVGNRIRLGLEAPGEVRVLRGELACRSRSDGYWPSGPAVAPRRPSPKG